MDRVVAAAPEPQPRATPPHPPAGNPGPGPAGAPPLRPRHRPAARAAVLLLAVPAVVAACRALDTDAVTPVPQLLSFLPWLTVPAGLAVLLAAAARRRVLSFVAVTVLGTTAWASLPYVPDPVTLTAPPEARVRVLAANVEFGEATGALVVTIRRERPTLVYVSECDRVCGRTLTTTFAAELPHHASVAADGSAGSVLLSAHPLRDRRVVPATMGMPGATAVIAGRPVDLQLAHPMPPLPGQTGLWKEELGRIRDAVARPAAGPHRIVAGDFNASQDHAAFRRILDAGRLQDAARLAGASRTPTWPAEGPLPPSVQIDHVLVSDGFTVRAVRFPELAGSDHRAVLADLDLHDGR
ncbi:endonuclease/exonuclease/phosphatase family protein [Streptomyces sp. NPDC058855]|uniref:endonuclease/exonuclease/phosphatase family protein n=1 Tax=Streptomyces sp. NPDC058855 TaxID=3346651 RepID=UPI0036BC1489